MSCHFAHRLSGGVHVSAINLLPEWGHKNNGVKWRGLFLPNDDCCNYCRGVDAESITRCKPFPSFWIRSFFLHGSQFSVQRESGYERYKAPRGGVWCECQRGYWYSLFNNMDGATHTAAHPNLMRALTLGGQNIVIQRRLTSLWFWYEGIPVRVGNTGLVGASVTLNTSVSISVVLLREYADIQCILPPSFFHGLVSIQYPPTGQVTTEIHRMVGSQYVHLYSALHPLPQLWVCLHVH